MQALTLGADGGGREPRRGAAGRRRAVAAPRLGRAQLRREDRALEAAGAALREPSPPPSSRLRRRARSTALGADAGVRE